MLTKAGFELAPSGYQTAALTVELSSPQGMEASFYPKVLKIFSPVSRRCEFNPARFNILQLTSALSGYHEKNFCPWGSF